MKRRRWDGRCEPVNELRSLEPYRTIRFNEGFESNHRITLKRERKKRETDHRGKVRISRLVGSGASWGTIRENNLIQVKEPEALHCYEGVSLSNTATGSEIGVPGSGFGSSS